MSTTKSIYWYSSMKKKLRKIRIIVDIDIWLDLKQRLIWQKKIWKSAIFHSIKLPFNAEVDEKFLNVIYYLHSKIVTMKYLLYNSRKNLSGNFPKKFWCKWPWTMDMWWLLFPEISQIIGRFKIFVYHFFFPFSGLDIHWFLVWFSFTKISRVPQILLLKSHWIIISSMSLWYYWRYPTMFCLYVSLPSERERGKSKTLLDKNTFRCYKIENWADYFMVWPDKKQEK